MSHYLQALREIAGVEGVFLLSVSGVIVERDLPGYIPDDVLAVVAERVDRLFEATADASPGADEMLLAFAGTSLFLRRFDGLLVGVLASPKLNVEGVRIAANLLRRRLAAKPAPATQSAISAHAASFSPPLVPQFSGMPSRPSPASAPVSSKVTSVAKAPPARAPAPPAKPKSKIWG